MIADRRRLVAGVLDGDPRAVARSISLVEAEGAAAADTVAAEHSTRRTNRQPTPPQHH